MLINVAKPQYSKEELDQALYSELRNGVMAKAAMEKVREVKAAKEAEEIKKLQHLGFKGLRCVAVTPAWEWFNIRRKYGNAAMHDKGFIKDYQKYFPHLAPNKL